MAKAPNLSNVTNIYTSAPTINANNERIRGAFQNTLSRDGSTPNQMEADLDMNSNDILNVGNLTLEDGRDLSDIVDEVEQYRDETKQFRDEAELIVGSIQDVTPRRSVDSYIGDGVTTEFATSELAIDKNFTNVFISGVYQNKDSYEVVGGNIVFSEAPPLDAEIEITVLENSTVGTTSAEYVAYENTSVADVLDDLVENAGNTFSYNTRQDFIDDLPNLQDDLTVFVRGQPYIVDSTATGYDSALQDLGVDGVRRPSEVRNVYLGAFFTTQNDNTIHLCTSLDGVNFSALNAGALSIPGAGGFSQRDPSVTWFNGEWWVFGTGAAAGSHDFVAYRSRDLITWSKHQCVMGGGPYFSNAVPFPGGTTPCNSIWAPEPYIEDGRLYIAIAVRYGADLTDAFGNTIRHHATVLVELLDTATMTFSVPQIPDMDGETTSLIDMSICKVGSTYWGAVKDDAAKTIQIRSASSLLGPWVLNQTISDTQRSIEAPCLTPFYTKGLNSDAVVAGWRLYVDNNRTGPGATDPDVLVGRPYFATVTGDPGGTWSSLTPAYFDVPVRHGSVVNLASLPPEAMQSVMQAVVGRAQQRPALTGQVLLGSGSVTIRPQPDMTYYVEGAGNDVALNITDGPADRFWLGVWSGDPATGITVSGGYVPRPFLLGYGRDNDTVIEMRRRGTGGQYYPSGQVRKSEFRANKGGTSQAIAGATNVTVTWPNEVYDRGGHFDSNGWTPPRGVVSIVAGVTMSGTEAGENNRISILKNGNPIQTTFAPGVAGANVSLTAVVEGETANGTDVFTVQVRGNGAGTKSVSGIVAETFFHGVAW